MRPFPHPRIRRARRTAAIFIGLAVLLLAVAAACFAKHAQNNRYLLEASAFIFDRPGNDEAKAIALAHFVATHGARTVDPDSASLVAKVEHTLPFELSPVTVLKEGFALPDARRFGPCGQLSRTVRAIAWLRRIPSHKVLMGRGPLEHAMVALEVEGRWLLFDPTYDFYWTNASGHVASIAEVRGDPAIFRQIYRKVPNYPYTLADATYFRWSRLGRLGAGLRSALAATIGEARVAEIDTPQLYDRPWWGYAWAAALSGVAALALGLAILGRARWQSDRETVRLDAAPVALHEPLS
jgi:hypothetical protein